MVEVDGRQHDPFVANGSRVRLSEPLHQVVFCIGLQALHRFGGEAYVSSYVLRSFEHVAGEGFWCEGEVGGFLGRGGWGVGSQRLRVKGQGRKGRSERSECVEASGERSKG